MVFYKMPICPRTGIEINILGKHVLIDLYEASYLNDMDYIEKSCVEAVLATGATIISKNFHHFGGDGGVSGIILLAESHLSFHSWNEYGIALIDIFTCGTCDPTLAVPVFEEKFKTKKKKISIHNRGQMENIYI